LAALVFTVVFRLSVAGMLLVSIPGAFGGSNFGVSDPDTGTMKTVTERSP
jgi:hypothetical protein